MVGVWYRQREGDRLRDPAIDRRASEIMERRQCDWVEAWARAFAEVRNAGSSDDAQDVLRCAGRATPSARIGNATPQGARAVAPGRSVLSAALPGSVMRSAERTEIDPAAAEIVAKARGGGAPLDDALRRALEAALGTHLGDVRVHTGAEADAAARALGARAFAIDDNVWFQSGAYDPHRPDGQRLIAHEIAHTVQARSRTSAAPATVSRPEDPAERDAEAFADQFIRELHGVGRPDTRPAAPRGLAAPELRAAPGERADRASSEHVDALPRAIPLPPRPAPIAPGVVARQASGPASAPLTPATDADRRAFVRDTIEFLRGAADYYRQLGTIRPDAPQFADAAVRALLPRWRAMMEAQGNMVLNRLGGDSALYQALRAAYTAAVAALLDGAARLTRRSQGDTYEAYRELVFEWAIPTQQVAGITTPLPLSAQVDPSTHNAELMIGRIRFEFLADAQMTPAEARGGRAQTRFKIPFRTPGFRWTNDHVTEFEPVSDPVIQVQTRYPPGWNPADTSAYGRGTTNEDVAAGDTSLRFHEGRHGSDFLRFAREHPFPQFTGRVGMTTAQFRAAIAAYRQAIDEYNNALENYSVQSTDCVGTTIDDDAAAHGNASAVCAP